VQLVGIRGSDNLRVLKPVGSMLGANHALNLSGRPVARVSWALTPIQASSRGVERMPMVDLQIIGLSIGHTLRQPENAGSDGGIFLVEPGDMVPSLNTCLLQDVFSVVGFCTGLFGREAQDRSFEHLGGLNMLQSFPEAAAGVGAGFTTSFSEHVLKRPINLSAMMLVNLKREDGTCRNEYDIQAEMDRLLIAFADWSRSTLLA
jgi:hypothetical protein